MDTLDKGTLEKLQELIEASSEPGKPPSRKVLMELLDTVELADDVKENLKAMLTGDVPKVFGSWAGGTFLALLFILLVFAMICKFFSLILLQFYDCVFLVIVILPFKLLDNSR